MPFLHEARVALEFVDLDTAHLLFAHSGDLLVFVVEASGIPILPVLLVLKLVEVRLHVELLLGLVERVYALFEELVLDAIVLLLGVRDFLGGLVITELARLGQHGDVCSWVHLLQAHLQLVEEAEGEATLPLHDLVDHLRVKLDVEVS